MKVVLVDREARTYIGPWEWHDSSDVCHPHMLYADAMAEGYDQAQATAPAPVEVEAWKVKLVLRKRGLFAAMQAGIDAMTGPNALMVQSRWEYGGTLPRDGDTVNELCLTALGYTPSQTDDLFREADRIPD